MTLSLLLLPLGGVVGVLARRRVDDAAFRAGYRWMTALIAVVRGFLAGWIFRGSPSALAALALVAATELLCAALLCAVTGGRDGPVAGFAAHSNTTYWSLPAAAVLVGDVGVALVTLYEMVTAPRVGPSIRRLQTAAGVPAPAGARALDLSPVLVGALGMTAGLFVAPPTWAGDVLLPLGVLAGVLGGLFFGLALHVVTPAPPALRTAAKVVALRAVVLPLPLLVAALAGLHVPLSVWLLVTGLAPFNTVVLARLYGYSTEFATAVVLLSVVPTTLCVGVLAAV